VYHLLQGNMTGAHVWTPVFYIGAEQKLYSDELEQISQVIDYELIPIGERAFYAYLREQTAAPDKEIYTAFTHSTLVVIPPIEYTTQGTMRITVVGKSTALQSAIDSLPPDVDVDIDRIEEFAGPKPAVASLLRPRQRETIEAAFSAGYYEVPRDTTIEAIADRVDCTPGTASEHLRKAEAKLITYVLE
jgi:predicted DNA binding protein